LHPLVSVEATGVCIPTDNNEIFLEVDADIIEFLSFIQKSVLAGGLNAKHPLWYCTISNPPGEKHLDSFDVN
jgi:hypothetical protein